VRRGQIADLLGMTDGNILERDSRTRRPSLLSGNPARILGGWFGVFLDRHVPAGYEDETGFHCGTPFQSNQSSATGSRLEEMIALPGGDLI
jgi:hypothetical protein